MKLCEVLIPSRNRPEQLLGAIDSIRKSATGTNYGISIRIDDNDDKTMRRADEIRAYPEVNLVIGPEVHYQYLDRDAYTPMAEKSGAQWVWIFNDDMTMEGFGWDERLAEVPTTGFWCQPEIHKLGLSTYARDERSCAPIFVNGCWSDLGINPTIPSPCDAVLVQELKHRHWHPRFLLGIGVWHQRNK